MKTDKFCQSCAMPIDAKNAQNRGTELDGSKSDKYCHYCYSNGQFTFPNATYEETLTRCLSSIDSMPINKIQKFIMRKSYPSLLKQMDRWK